MKQQKQKQITTYSEQEKLKTKRIGVKQHIIINNISKFDLIQIHKPPQPPIYLLLLSNDQILIFDHNFPRNQQSLQGLSQLADSARFQINIRLNYRLAPLLHIKIRHSLNFQCLFVILNNGNIAVFNEELYLLKQTQIDIQSSLKIKHCLDYEYYEKQTFREVRKIKNGFFVFLYVDEIQIHEVEIHTNHKMSKFKPSYKFSFNQINQISINQIIHHPVKLYLFSFLPPRVIIPQNNISQSKGNKQDQNQQENEKHLISNDYLILACNCSREVAVILVSKQSMKILSMFKITKVCEIPFVILDIQVSLKPKRIYLSLSNGCIQVYSFKLQKSKLLSSSKCSQDPISYLHLCSSNKLLAYSSNSLISLINIHTFIVEQKFRAGTFSQIYFVNDSAFVGLGVKSSSIFNLEQKMIREDQFTKELILTNLNINFKKIYEHNSQISQFYIDDKRQLLQFADHSLIINKYENSSQIFTIPTYLPPKSVNVKSIARNIFQFNEEEYWILTQKSQIYRYRIGSKAVNIEKIIHLHKFYDKYSIEYKYNINCFIFCKKTLPIEFDSEMVQKQYLSNHKKYTELQPLCLGTSSGELLIVSLKYPTKIILRIKQIDTDIDWIIEVLPVNDPDQNRGIILYGSTKIKQGFIFEISSHSLPQEHFKLQMGEGRIQQVNQSMFAVLNQASFNLFHFKVIESKCTCYREDHYNPGLAGYPTITTISYSQNLQYLITGYSIGQILIWKVETQCQPQNHLRVYPLILLENSKEETIEFAHFRFDHIFFNLGTFIVSYSVSNLNQEDSFKKVCSYTKIGKSASMLQFNLKGKEKIKKQELPIIHSMKQITKPKQEILYLPKIKNVTKSKRSSSLSIINKRLNFQLMFHNPDSQIYRSLLNKSYIH